MTIGLGDHMSHQMHQQADREAFLRQGETFAHQGDMDEEINVDQVDDINIKEEDEVKTYFEIFLYVKVSFIYL